MGWRKPGIKLQKRRYKFEITEEGKDLVKEVFHETCETDAHWKFVGRIHKLAPGSVIVLYVWNKRFKEWVFLKRGGKEKAQIKQKTLF